MTNSPPLPHHASRMAWRTWNCLDWRQMRRSAVESQLEILGQACSRLARIQPALIEQVPNPKLAIDQRNRIMHGYVAVDDEIVYLAI